MEENIATTDFLDFTFKRGPNTKRVWIIFVSRTKLSNALDAYPKLGQL